MASLEEILDDLSDMPTLPDVVAKLTQLIADPKTTANDINDTLSSDAALSAKILRIVNSSYYGFSRRIASITNAVVILGFNQVRNLALSAFIFDNFSQTGENVGFDLKAFWKHCIGVAFTAGQIAKKVDPRLEEDAFICGLLHDLGKYVMAQKSRADLGQVIRLAVDKRQLFINAEHQLLEYDHAVLGSALVERWNLPENLVEVIRHHHEPLAMEAEPRTVLLAAITNTADITARALLMGSGGDNKIPRLTRGVWELLGLGWNELDLIARRSTAEFMKSDIFFSSR